MSSIEKLDSETLLSILTDFAPKMGAKWDFIGIQLRERDLVGQLRSTSQLGSEKIPLIIDRWLQNNPKDPVKTMIEVLRSPSVGLKSVATDFQKRVTKEQQEKASQLAAEQRSTSHPPHEGPPTGTYSPAGTFTSHMEAAVTDGPSSQPSVCLGPPPNSSSVAQGLHPPQPSDSGSLPLSQQAVVDPQSPVGGGRADSSPLQEPVEENRKPVQTDVQRGPVPSYTAEPGGTEEDGSIQCFNEGALEESFGQRSVPFSELLRVAAAVCRIKWTSTTIDPNTNLPCTSTFRGSGSFVVDGEQFFLLTCCHNFLTRKEGNPRSLQQMSAVNLKEKLTANCQTAMYEVSDRTTFKTNELAASDVLALDVQGSPHLHIVQDKDLLVIKVRNPAEFGVHECFPLKSDVSRKDLLRGAKVFSIVQFPFDEKCNIPRPLEIAIGERFCEGQQDDPLKYKIDTYVGSSGSPVLYCGNQGIIIMAVHLRSHGSPDSPPNSVYNVGSVLTETFLSDMKEFFSKINGN